MNEATQYTKARKQQLEAFTVMMGWFAVLLPVVGAMHNAMGYSLWAAGVNQAAAVAIVFTAVFGVSAIRLHFKLAGD